MPTLLSVNVNAIAQLRNRRDLPWPHVVQMARLALSAGAHGITVHPRPDQRHIRFTDVDDLAAMLASEYPEREFNIEGYPSEAFLSLVEKAAPHQVTLVPDDPQQATSDHGWDFAANAELLESVVARLQAGGRRVSLFCDAEPGLVPMAAATGCDRIELYTGPFGATYDDASAADRAIGQLAATTTAAGEHGLGVNAGHDLTVANLPPLLARAPGIAEVSIGHALIADALEYGMARTVQRYLEVCGSRT